MVIYKKYKKQNSGLEEVKEQKEAPKKKHYDIPYMPLFDSLGDPEKDGYVHKIVTKLQTEKGPDGKPVTSDIGEEGLLKAAQVGEDLVTEMDRLFRGVASIEQRKKEMKSKFAAIMSVLISQPSYKKSLIYGEITAKDMVTKKKEDFISEEIKKKKDNAAAEKMQANRTDWAREQDK